MKNRKKGEDAMISSDVMRGYNDMLILYLIYEAPSYGYEISKQIKEMSQELYVMKETTLYSAFSRLEKLQYIEAFFGDESGGKRRTYYRITEAGKQYYQEKCVEWREIQQVVEKFIRK